MVVELPAHGAARASIVTATIGNEIKLSLQTSDPGAAKFRHSYVQAHVRKVLDAIENGPQTLKHRELVQLSGEVYRLYVEGFQEDPGAAEVWAAVKAISRAASQGRLTEVAAIGVGGPPDEVALAAQHFGSDLTAGVNRLATGDSDASIEARFGELTDWVLALHALEVNIETRKRLLKLVDPAFMAAAWNLKRKAEGDYSEDPAAARFGGRYQAAPAAGALTLTTMFEDWIREARPAASTISTWRTVVKSLTEHVSNKDASLVNPADIVTWKDALITRLTPKTVNDSYLSCANRLFSYAIQNGRLSANPVTGVRAADRAQAGRSRLPYETNEVARLLGLASRESKACRRWLPLMAASTGARIGELAQIWSDQVVTRDGIPVLLIRPAPDGGSLKTQGSERTVPLHSTLVEAGFLEFAQRPTARPLFYGKAKARPGGLHPSKGITNRLASWIRDQGFNDPRKSPTHALRHWWKTAAAQAHIQDSIADAIQGHVTPGEGSTYRHFDLRTLAHAVNQIPVPSAEP